MLLALKTEDCILIAWLVKDHSHTIVYGRLIFKLLHSSLETYTGAIPTSDAADSEKFSTTITATRKLSYRKDDRAMRRMCGCPENFRESLTTPTATYFSRNFNGLLF